MRVATTPLLTDERIAKTRAHGQRSQPRRFDLPRVLDGFEGAQLHNLRFTEMQCEATEACDALCVATEQGPAQTIYMNVDRVLLSRRC